MCHTRVRLVLAGVCVEAKFHPFEVVLEVLELLEVVDASPPLLLDVLVVFGVLQLSPRQPRALQWLPLDVGQGNAKAYGASWHTGQPADVRCPEDG